MKEAKDDDDATCPVCFSLLAESELIPIYENGRSNTAEEAEAGNIHACHAATTAMEIPDRPKARPISEDEITASESDTIVNVRGFAFPAPSLQKVHTLRLFTFSHQREEGVTEDEYHFKFCASEEESTISVVSPRSLSHSRYRESRIVRDPEQGPLYFVDAPQTNRDAPSA
ncbi:hypothetical protein KP509_14G070900 [Ceratopteris richardii]|uniref:Uncharacterized protein n=1 Tax=Ceratopteris richardii TaxID=49495 RepID=A0A8T2TE23_CERRI|nr:hypothetical protein KP509_14G070900 [Ceratopteris richardii]